MRTSPETELPPNESSVRGLSANRFAGLFAPSLPEVKAFDFGASDPVQHTLEVPREIIKPPYVPQHRWDSWNESQRRALSDSYQVQQEREARDEAKRIAAAQKPRRQYQGRFSTDYAITWGKSKGWKFVEREGYDFRNKSHHDIARCADVRFRGPDGEAIFVQGAGAGERADHYRKFLENQQRLRDFRDAQFFYVEFNRGSQTPIKEEKWL